MTAVELLPIHEYPQWDDPVGGVERALRQAGREIKSGYELAQALIAAAGSQALNESASLAYAEAARSIESDYEQRRALSELVAKGRLTRKT